MSSSITNNTGEQHGGNLSWLEQHYPKAPRPLLDLSTGINPYGYSLPMPELGWNYRLADSACVAAAQGALAQYYGVQNANIALSAGMQPVITALASLRLKEFSPSNIGIFTPTYAEHERVWQAMGHRCHSYDATLEQDVVILCNPNNPDGRTMTAQDVLALAATLERRDGWLIVDESFADVMPELSVAGYVGRQENLVVLRSCGKFFGIAGMRVSCAIASAEAALWLRGVLGPWAVSTPACHVLPVMMKDTGWIESMRMRLDKESAAWRAVLEKKFTIAGFTPLFTLVEAEHTQAWHHHLASNGILVRRFGANASWLRFGLPEASSVARLSSVLASGPAHG